MQTNSPHLPWQSAYMDDHEEDGTDRGRAIGTLIFAGALAAAIIKILATPEGPFPELFCTLCAIVAACGITIASAATQRKATGSWLKATVKLPTLIAGAAALALMAFTVYRYVLEHRIAYARAVTHFKTVEDHVDFMLQADNPRLRNLTLQKMKEAFTPEEIEQGYVRADYRAIQEECIDGKGLFLAVGPRNAGQEACVTVLNKTGKNVILVCDGPQNLQVPIAPSGQETFLLSPGDYQTTVTFQPQDNSEPMTMDKHVVPAIRYRGIIDTDEEDHLQVGELDPKELVKER